MKFFIIALFTGLSLTGLALAEQPSSVKIIVEENNRPLTFDEEGEPMGLFVDVVLEIGRRLNIDITLEMQPWARAYHTLENDNDAIVISVARNDLRGDLFQWVGPVHGTDTYLYAIKGSGVKAKNIDEARKLRSIGAHRSSNNAQRFQDMGFTNLEKVTDDLQNVKKLLIGRIDAMPSTQRNIKARLEKANIPPKKLEKLFVLWRDEDYIAFSKGADPAFVQKWQAAFDSMRDDGTYQEIYRRWIEEEQTQFSPSGCGAPETKQETECVAAS